MICKTDLLEALFLRARDVITRVPDGVVTKRCMEVVIGLHVGGY